MCQSHVICTALVCPDLVAPGLTVRFKTQTNPEGNDEGPTQAVHGYRTLLGAFVCSVSFKLE